VVEARILACPARERPCGQRGDLVRGGGGGGGGEGCFHALGAAAAWRRAIEAASAKMRLETSEKGEETRQEWTCKYPLLEGYGVDVPCEPTHGAASVLSRHLGCGS
jgi:hypothetical protein